MKLDSVRKFALSLPQATEDPHFHFSSFRVRGKIFATVPPEEKHLHIFVGETEREIFTQSQPRAYEKLLWGKKVIGLRVTLANAKAADVKDLLRKAWELKAPKSLRNARVTRFEARKGA